MALLIRNYTTDYIYNGDGNLILLLSLPFCENNPLNSGHFRIIPYICLLKEKRFRSLLISVFELLALILQAENRQFEERENKSTGCSRPLGRGPFVLIHVQGAWRYLSLG